jgi:predicted permease
MTIIARLRSYAASLFHRSQRESQISDELQFHIESRAADLERTGLTPAEALRRARIEFGAVDKHREDIRTSLGLRLFDELRDDLRYAIRMLRSSPGFTAVAIGSLALGIGANTVIFSLAKGVLLDRLPVPHPEQLTMVTLVGGDKAPIHSSWGSWFSPEGKPNQYPLLTYPIYKMLQQQNREHPVLDDIFAFKDLGSFNRLSATIDGHAELVTGQMVSGNFYDQLQVRPQIGRTIQPADDDVAGSGNVVMISDGMWSRLFGRSPDAIGKTIQLNLIPMSIVGVNPPEFTGANSVQIAPDVFFPLSMQPVLSPIGIHKDHPSVLDDSEMWWVEVMAREKPGIPSATAQAAMTTWIEQDIRATMKLEKDVVMPKVVLMDGNRGIDSAHHGFSTQIYVLSALAGLVLLLACANLANLLLARSAARQREIAVRMALGASRGRVLRQVLTESLLLSLLGGLGGLALGYFGRNVIPHMYKAPWQTSVVRADFDPAIVIFAAAVSVLTGVLFGIAPAWQATRTSVNSGLKDAAASTTRRRKGLAGRGLVTLQIALSTLLVVGAGLFGSTLRNLYKQQLGFVPQNILLFSVRAPDVRYPAPKDVQLHEKIEERLARIPGLSAVTLSRSPLIGGGGSNSTFYPAGQPVREGHDGVAMMHDVGRTFFDVYRIPLLSGRTFNSSDTSTSQTVAIVNQSLALQFWPNQDPIGKTFQRNRRGNDTREFQVVGVVADAKYMNLSGKAPATFYALYDQEEGMKEMTYEVKTPLPLNDILPQIRTAVADIDPDLPVRDVRTQQAQIDATVTQQKTFAVLTGAFGVLALILACIGIYGLMAYDVARRTSEIGIRMALGAQASQMLRMILGEASWLAAMGVAAGLGIAFLLARFIRSMLFGLTPTDPLILTGSALLLLVVALLSGWGPARRAARTDPMEALRHE